jgi:hypothetical protein
MPAFLTLLAGAALGAGVACAPAAGRGLAPAPPPADSGLSLALNLPAFRLDVRTARGTVRSYTVAIGSRRYPTPRGRYEVTSVEMNPWWHPPDSEWARDEKITPPGPTNPMGRAKLNFHALYFFHGTPAASSLGSAASHGCVRMANGDAQELARIVLAAARPDVPPEAIAAAEADPRRTRHYVLHAPVPVEIVYRTAEVRDGALELHPDVYRLESTTPRSRALAALAEMGYGEGRVDAAVLDSVVAAGRRGHARVELARLVLAGAPSPSRDARRADARYPGGRGPVPADAEDAARSFATGRM